jgi:hypothetical protein
MADNQNITKIPAPRVPLVDDRTGLISREWFRFFNNVYTISGGATQGVAQIVNGGTGADNAAQARLNLGVGSGNGTVTSVTGIGSVNGIALIGTVTTSGALKLGGVLTGVNLTTQVTGILPVANGGTGLAARPSVATKVADFTLANTEGWIINNKSGATCTVTLPAASAWSGRAVTFKNLQTETVVSASSNVAPIGSATPGTAILPATVGAWATLVSDGTNWVVMAS